MITGFLICKIQLKLVGDYFGSFSYPIWFY